MYLLRTNATPKGVPGQRPHLGAFVAPSSSSFWAFVAPSSSPKCVCVSVASIRLPGTMLSSMDVDGSVILFHGVFLFRSPVAGKTPNTAESPQEHGGATDSAAALPIPD